MQRSALPFPHHWEVCVLEAELLNHLTSISSKTVPKAPISLGCDEFPMGLRIDSPNHRELLQYCRETFAWYCNVLACIANSSRTGRQSFKHVILFCATKIIAKPSPSHRICWEPVANPSPTLRRCSQTHRKEISAICTMRQICGINKTISRLNCDK